MTKETDVKDCEKERQKVMCKLADEMLLILGRIKHIKYLSYHIETPQYRIEKPLDSLIDKIVLVFAHDITSYFIHLYFDTVSKEKTSTELFTVSGYYDIEADYIYDKDVSLEKILIEHKLLKHEQRKRRKGLPYIRCS